MNRIQDKLVSDAFDHEELLTEWEYEFISDMADKPESYVLSEKQNEILTHISQKINRI